MIETQVKFFRHSGLRYITPYVNGKMHGLQIGYYSDSEAGSEDDRMRWEIPYVNDNAVGVEKVWNKQGEIITLSTWGTKRINGIKIYFEGHYKSF